MTPPDIMVSGVLQSSFFSKSQYNSMLVVVDNYPADIDYDLYINNGFRVTLVECRDGALSTTVAKHPKEDKSSEKSVIILIGMRFDKNDYESLLNSAQHFILCSGDNSFTNAVSRGKLPLYMIRDWKVKFIEALLSYVTMPSFHLSLQKYIKGLKLASIPDYEDDEEYDDTYGIFKEHAPYVKDESISEKQNEAREASYYFSLALTPDLCEYWYAFCFHLFREKNIYFSLPGIVKNKLDSLNPSLMQSPKAAPDFSVQDAAGPTTLFKWSSLFAIPKLQLSSMRLDESEASLIREFFPEMDTTDRAHLKRKRSRSPSSLGDF